jgi:membrane fusion protein (multidrug efflux system)
MMAFTQNRALLGERHVEDGIVRGASIEFYVPYPERAHAVTVACVSHSLDQKSRTTALGLDVFNRAPVAFLARYPSVRWLLRRVHSLLFVPKTNVIVTTERTCVIRNRSGRKEWVKVVIGAGDGDSIEISGNLRAEELVVRRATDEIRKEHSD